MASSTTSEYYATLPINVQSTVSPSSPHEAQPTIGLIGMGAMGRMYANLLGEAGWSKIHVCDLPEKFDALKEEFRNTPNITPMKDGHAVSRSSDFIIYSVEAEFVDSVVAQFGPSTKMNAIVAGQTSVKAPEKAAFEKYLPQDVHIVSCHSLHGPTVSPVGQPLIIVHHRASNAAVQLVENVLRPLGSRFVYLSFEEHDRVTANTQAVTHAAFLSMGSAWHSSKAYPWEQGLYVGGIETAKVNITLRIYSNAWHVYAGLAILNPSANIQISRYAESATELFKMMIEGGNVGEVERKFRERVEWARQTVFGNAAGGNGNGKTRRPILLSEEVLDQFTLGKTPRIPHQQFSGEQLPISQLPSKYRPNSHLSLLAMVDCWAQLSINPYIHLSLAATPIFRLFLGVAEHLFNSPTLLAAAIHSALFDTWHRADDFEFVISARAWSQCVSFGSFEMYKWRFEQTKQFFEGRFEEANLVGGQMIKAIMDSEGKRERELEDERGLNQ